ncbi:glutathione S-transferase [Thiomicrorhabdus xiamenensis]|uniref:Glutathione S-transferase n=1 Tax=Thiomicrorhabdus xiamenensis TaxID=2739063 RepID=A0A7D4NPJ9_9GAMM|nr:glutathione S-transferase [Thiomicrorhabdus xiamenensis]QKI88471.1 glutathione S-transferase [Thiomicrorhabdus xiamenensis]
MYVESDQNTFPVLYSYRRCPYAMRARLALYFSGIQVEQREIVFWDKPDEMLAASAKGTVPVLLLPDGEVLEESWDIMCWALKDKQGKSPLYPQDAQQRQLLDQLIAENDADFKQHLDDYKYPELCQKHYPELSAEEGHFKARAQGEVTLQKLERRLSQSAYLLGAALSVADLAIFPFVRQFAHVDKIWWQRADYPNLKAWLDKQLSSGYFAAVMKNRPVWEAGHLPLWVDEPELKRKDQLRAKAEGKRIPR